MARPTAALWMLTVAGAVALPGCDPPCLVGNLCNEGDIYDPIDSDDTYLSDFDCADGGTCEDGWLHCDLVVRKPAGFAVLEGCSGVDGHFAIEGSAIQTLPALPQLAVVTGNLVVQSTGLETLDGLEGLVSIGAFGAVGNAELVDLGALDGVECVSAAESAAAGPCERVWLNGNSSLVEIPALSFPLGLRRFEASENPLLQSVSGLAGVQTLDAFDLGDTASLTTLDGLEELESVGSLILQRNWSLESLAPLSSLQAVTGTLMIDNDDALTNLDGLSNVTTFGTNMDSYLYVARNDQLEDLDGLRGIASMSGSLWIYLNQVLPTCEALELRDYLDESTAWSPFPSNCVIYDNLADECSE
jgi:hypothetical protein